MEMVRSKMMSVIGNKERVVSLFLLGAFAALGFRSAEQQREIDALEAERASLRSGNKAMMSAMWEWRQHLFALAESDPSSAPIALARLRSIYSEEERQQSLQMPPADVDSRIGEEAAEDSITIA